MSLVSRLAACAVAATLFAPAVAAAQTTEHTLSVVGRGQVEVRPDRGEFTVAVVRLSKSANVARSRANRQIAAIVAGLRKVGVPRDQITTTNVGVSREKYRVRKDGPVRTRFRAGVALRVEVDGLELLGRAIDAASRRGATAVYGPRLSFSAERRQEASLGAEAAALQDARERADAAAAETGQQIVGVQSIDLDPSLSDFRAFSLGSADSGAGSSAPSPTRIFAARRKVTSLARVTYLIEPAA